jgi:pSer/pThr/pTyr-binding forkhead associated (FHA) protein
MSSADQVATLKYSGPDGVYFLELKSESTCIGRSAEQDLVMRESFVSRRHAVISRLADGFEVVDQKSSHGTFLNGVRIERAMLAPGDMLQGRTPRIPLWPTIFSLRSLSCRSPLRQFVPLPVRWSS